MVNFLTTNFAEKVVAVNAKEVKVRFTRRQEGKTGKWIIYLCLYVRTESVSSGLGSFRLLRSHH